MTGLCGLARRVTPIRKIVDFGALFAWEANRLLVNLLLPLTISPSFAQIKVATSDLTVEAPSSGGQRLAQVRANVLLHAWHQLERPYRPREHAHGGRSLLSNGGADSLPYAASVRELT